MHVLWYARNEMALPTTDIEVQIVIYNNQNCYFNLVYCH